MLFLIPPTELASLLFAVPVQNTTPEQLLHNHSSPNSTALSRPGPGRQHPLLFSAVRRSTVASHSVPAKVTVPGDPAGLQLWLTLHPFIGSRKSLAPPTQLWKHLVKRSLDQSAVARETAIAPYRAVSPPSPTGRSILRQTLSFSGSKSMAEEPGLWGRQPLLSWNGNYITLLTPAPRAGHRSWTDSQPAQRSVCRGSPYVQRRMLRGTGPWRKQPKPFL